MKLLSSLTNRIFMAAAAVAVASMGLAIYVVNRSVTREAEAELERGLVEAGTVVEQYRATVSESFTLVARTIADLSLLKSAVVDTDPQTVQPMVEEYQRQIEQSQIKADLLLVTDRSGRVFGLAGRSRVSPERVASQPAIRDAIEGRETSALWPQPGGILQVVTVPITIRQPREILGSVSVGFLLDNDLARRFKGVTGSDILFAMPGGVVAGTLPADQYPAVAPALAARGITRVLLGGDEFVALRRPLGTGPAAPVAIVLRSRTERLRFLNTIQTALVITTLVAVALATVLSYTIARTVTRPLAAITHVMREMAATGDLTRRIELRRARWEDEDARVLATAFNTLTESISRFQREAAQRERLLSLGRLSTVIAHEIRNPLMIIKGALRALGRDDLPPHDVREAVSDIDEEVARLNRLVNEVLDFARPIKFECAEIDLNALCAESAAASAAGDPGPAIHLALDPGVGRVVTDAERLRGVLVNMLGNAREAVLAGAPVPAAVGREPSAIAGAAEYAAAIELSTRRIDGDRVLIEVRDRGVGLTPEDLARVFEPYFTTKRTGTGLGLPIAKNVIEGLGGSITIRSRPGEGTELRIDLPIRLPIQSRQEAGGSRQS